MAGPNDAAAAKPPPAPAPASQQQQEEPEPLLPLLREAMPQGPVGIAGADAGAALALALHCLAVSLGGLVVDPPPPNAASRFAPPRAWHGTFHDEWVFHYAAPGKANRIALHCSLQRASGRMLVSTVEIDNARNVHRLGLQLPNYVPDAAALLGADWRGVVSRQGALAAMFWEHVLDKVLAAAAPLPPGRHGSSALPPLDAAAHGGHHHHAAASLLDRVLGPQGSAARRYALPAAMVVAVVAAALAVAHVAPSRRQRRTGGGRA